MFFCQSLRRFGYRVSFFKMKKEEEKGREKLGVVEGNTLLVLEKIIKYVKTV